MSAGIKEYLFSLFDEEIYLGSLIPKQSLVLTTAPFVLRCGWIENRHSSSYAY